MLFNSYPFLFVYLPVTVLLFFWLGRYSHRLAATWLTAASLIFYGYWNPAYVGLLLASIFFNYTVGFALAREQGDSKLRRRQLILTVGITGDLLVLGYYKYANFFLGTVDAVIGSSLTLEEIILPLGISFFTFTQIAFLVDAYYGKAKEYDFIHYALFVTYFPHLIAGPVLHHKEMMPQFGQASTYRATFDNFTVGLTIFAIGLFKKVVLADGVAPYGNSVFAAAEAGESLQFFQAWGGALAYTLQLYFDFSGYSDMAIGLSRIFGVALPLNFNSPYKAWNITEFWRRWHMTLSRFLRDYLYIPLGGNRKGPVRRYINLVITMLLGGLWHGAAWTFVLWGGLHGLYLVINHAWQALRQRLGQDVSRSTRIGRAFGTGLTFLAVVVGWVFFRATTLDSAGAMLAGMAGLNGVSLPVAFTYYLGSMAGTLEAVGVQFTLGGGTQFVQTYAWLGVLLPIVFLAPNTQELMAHHRPALEDRAHGGGLVPVPLIRWRWQPTPRWVAAMTLLTLAAVLSLSQPTEFLYFQF